MYVTDRDLEALLPRLEIDTEDPRHPFDSEAQIQPSSIDLWLDTCFWRPRGFFRRRRIDFRRGTLGELWVQRLFDRCRIRIGEGIELAPGEMLLGRTLEKFSVPNGYSGKLEGRSSFARLGLSIHCTGDFINPGWRGRMPLQLVNHGKATFVLTPYMDICQLVLIKNTGESVRPYGTEERVSKYMNEEGEPSRYWLDARMKKLADACSKVDLDERIRKEFRRVLGGKDIWVLDRFDRYMDRLPREQLTSGQDVLERFADRDTRRHRWLGILQSIGRWLPFAFFSVSLGSLFKPPYSTLHHGFWILTALLMIPGLYCLLFAPPPGDYLSRDDLA